MYRERLYYTHSICIVSIKRVELWVSHNNAGKYVNENEILKTRRNHDCSATRVGKQTFRAKIVQYSHLTSFKNCTPTSFSLN